MATDAYTAKISELASRYVSDNVRLWQRYAEGLQRVSEGVMPSADTAGKSRPSLRDVPVFTQQLMQLNLTHYSELLNTYADFTNRILTTVLQPQQSAPSPASPTPAPAAAGPTRLELVFDGVGGETISQSFAVVNKKSELIDVAFELTEFVAEDGGARFRAPVVFVPDTFALSPGAERVVECRISLGAAFVPGTRYMALVRVPGFRALDTALIIVPRQPQQRAGETAVFDAEPQESASTVEAVVVAPSEGAGRSVSRARTKSAGRRRKRSSQKKGPVAGAR